MAKKTGSTADRFAEALANRVPDTTAHAPVIRRFIAAISHIANVRGEDLIITEDYGKGRALADTLLGAQMGDHMVFHLQRGRVHLNLFNGDYPDITEVLTPGELGVLAREVMRWRSNVPALQTCRIHLRNRDDRETKEADERGANTFISTHHQAVLA